MKLNKIFGWSSALLLSTTIAHAQETNQPADFDQRLKQLQENFEQREQAMEKKFEQKIAAQDAEIESLKKQMASAPENPSPPRVAAASTNAVTQEQVKELNDKVEGVVEAQKKTLMSEFNPAIGFVGETIFSYNSKGSDQTGASRPGGFDFNQRSMELNIAASVDPFAKGYSVINASANSQTGEANVEVEEAALQTTSLPGNLELKAGRFFGEFGRLAYIHDHELPFVNRPLVLDQYIGGESQSDGLQINWLPPLTHYVSLTAGVGDKFGDDPNDPGSYRSAGKLAYWGHLSTGFDLTPDWQLEGGVSGLWTPNADSGENPQVQANGYSTIAEKERRLAGLDLKLSYVPLRNNQFRSLVWGTEVLYSDNRYQFDPDGLPGNLDDYTSNVGSLGLYSYVTYKWHRQWSGGFLFEFVQNDQNDSDQTYACSPYVTWALTHWNQLRLQYTHTDQNIGVSSDAVYLQWTWIIGSHSHGWQSR
jgi:hypothetical protein